MSTTFPPNTGSPFTSDPGIPAAGGADFDGDGAEAPEKKGRKKLLLAIVAILLAAGGGYYWFGMRASAASAAPKPGETVPLESIQVNLAEGHYLSIGVAVQFTSDAKEVDGSKALNEIIETFSGASMDDVLDPTKRTEAQQQLLEHLNEAYEGDVYAVYYTDFVAQ